MVSVLVATILSAYAIKLLSLVDVPGCKFIALAKIWTEVRERVGLRILTGHAKTNNGQYSSAVGASGSSMIKCVAQETERAEVLTTWVKLYGYQYVSLSHI